MPRRLRRAFATRIRGPRYSNETPSISDITVFAANVATQLHVTVIPPANIQGVRKVKNFTLRIAWDPLPLPMAWALVYCPEGTVAQVSALTVGNVAQPVRLYESNQNVISSGILSAGRASTSPAMQSRLARNLQSNDSIVLLCVNLRPTPQFNFADCINMNFAITYYILCSFYFSECFVSDTHAVSLFVDRSLFLTTKLKHLMLFSFRTVGSICPHRHHHHHRLPLLTTSIKLHLEVQAQSRPGPWRYLVPLVWQCSVPLPHYFQEASF